MAENNKLAVTKDVGTQVLNRITELCNTGFRLPADFNAANAIKATMLELQQTVDKNKRPALEVCTKESIQSFLFNMCIKGLDVSKKTCYPIVRGDKLCLHVSYFGSILQVKRLFPDWSPVARVIREGDNFVYSIDPATGKMKLEKHEQKLENIDNDFVGAYMYLPCADGKPELYVMTRKQILKAWSKSSSQSLQTHKDFDEKMILKTIYNSGCTKVVNATPDPMIIPDDDEDVQILKQPADDSQFAEFEEVKDEQKQLHESKTKDGDAQPEQAKEEQSPAQEAPKPNDDEF